MTTTRLEDESEDLSRAIGTVDALMGALLAEKGDTLRTIVVVAVGKEGSFTLAGGCECPGCFEAAHKAIATYEAARCEDHGAMSLSEGIVH